MVKNLKALRVQAGLSQQALADALEISQQSVNRYENHKVEPDIALLVMMADFFEVSLDYLVGRTDEFGNNQKVLKGEVFIRKYRTLAPKERHYIERIMDLFFEEN